MASSGKRRTAESILVAEVSSRANSGTKTDWREFPRGRPRDRWTPGAAIDVARPCRRSPRRRRSPSRGLIADGSPYGQRSQGAATTRPARARCVALARASGIEIEVRFAVDDAIRKAEVLVEALGWIQQFRDRYVVVKLGGSALEEPENVRRCLGDVVFMAAVGMRPILVHGGGKSISRAMEAAGIQPKFVLGRRYTDEGTLEIVSRVLADDICEEIVEDIRSLGGRAVGLNFRSQNVLIAERTTLQGPAGETLDLGRVGEVVAINRDVLAATCRSGSIPVIPSIALDRSGGKLNVNADTAAAAVARLLRAEKLVFLSDVPGIFRDRKDPSTLMSHLKADEVSSLIETGVIDSGMIPKVEASLAALRAGVRKVHVIDAGVPHSLLLEIYSNTGIGTEIVR
ncbi:MAG: acetylglutamate kinase [Planctomyces sp.]|nr:acetylglutamate kinase [Planctomyces sp.]